MLVNIGKGLEMDVNVEKLPAKALEHAIYIGLRNILMDAHAGIAKTEADAAAKSMAMATKRLESLIAGENKSPRSHSTSPFEKELNRLAKIHGDAALKAKKVTAEGLDAWKIAFKKKPAVVALAHANADINVDLDETDE